MFTSFQDMETYIKEKQITARIALAGAHDDDTLAAVVNARKNGVADAVLIGHGDPIRNLLSAMGERAEDYAIVEKETEKECAAYACKLVQEGAADIPMKGLMQTSVFMRAILDKQAGFLQEGGLLSQATVLDYRQENRLLIISDCAVNIMPDYADKVKILQNAVLLAVKLGMEMPKVAVIAPVEVINPAIQATIDAAMLSKASQRGQIKGCIVDGPLALDNAVSESAAKHKGIVNEVAGHADILLMPDLSTGNVFTKSLGYFGGLTTAGTLNGTTSPVIMTSRTDTPENKYCSILTAILQAGAAAPG